MISMESPYHVCKKRLPDSLTNKKGLKTAVFNLITGYKLASDLPHPFTTFNKVQSKRQRDKTKRIEKKSIPLLQRRKMPWYIASEEELFTLQFPVFSIFQFPWELEIHRPCTPRKLQPFHPSALQFSNTKGTHFTTLTQVSSSFVTFSKKGTHTNLYSLYKAKKPTGQRYKKKKHKNKNNQRTPLSFQWPNYTSKNSSNMPFSLAKRRAERSFCSTQIQIHNWFLFHNLCVLSLFLPITTKAEVFNQNCHFISIFRVWKSWMRSSLAWSARSRP